MKRILIQRKFWVDITRKIGLNKMAGRIHIAFVLQQGVMAEWFCSCLSPCTLHLDLEKAQDSLQEV